MRLRSLILGLAALVMLVCSMPLAEAKGAKGEGKAVRPPPEMLALPRVRLAVPAANDTFRALELEVWLVMDKPEDAAQLGRSKDQITADMKETFMHYRWEAFVSPEEGVDLAKTLVKDSASHVAPNLPVQDVLIREMILR